MDICRGGRVSDEIFISKGGGARLISPTFMSNLMMQFFNSKRSQIFCYQVG